MKPPSLAEPNLDWKAQYWKDEPHGASWNRVKEALKRDWSQTKSDFNAGGKDLKQNLPDTVKQATGAEPIPASGAPNPATAASWNAAETGMRYGVGARQQYGLQYPRWNDDLERRLGTEWDEDKTGRPFSAVREDVRRGWDSKQ